MLAKAVKEHKPAGSTTLSQQLFPSSSPTAGRESVPRAKGFATNALQPASSSVLNASIPTVNKKFTNPLKRTASEMSSGSSGSLTRGRTYSTQSSTASDKGSVVAKLHEPVYFDENDFSDDEEIDLDCQESFTELERFTTPPERIVVGQKPSPSGQQNIISSIPIPWSPSPAKQNTISSNNSIESKSLDDQDGSVHYPDLPRLSSDSDRNLQGNEADTEAPRTAKRRTIPWLVKDEAAPQPNHSEPDISGAPKFVQDIINRQKKNNRNNTTVYTQEAVTPMPKDKSNSPHPWNKTSSAIKEDQKKLRQQANQGKKIIKDAQGDGLADTTGEKKAKSSKKAIHRVFLSDEQKKVLNLVVDAKKSVFFTGSAGTGKSVLMREIIQVLRMRFQKEPDRIAVTASTGLAACNVGGVTLHSFSGIGLGKESAEELVKKIKRNSKARNRWMRTKVLIIDEISMVDGDLFDKLERIARMIRNNGRPFGGIQLVVTGDFFQLPPVPDYGKVAKFSFEAGTWGTSIEHTIGLTQVFRQKDPTFANMLNEMRIGRLSSKSITAFAKLSRKLDFNDDVDATELFPTRLEVDNANNMRMRLIGGNGVTFTALDTGAIQDVAQRDKLLSNCMAPPQITLKKGAQVMLIKNIDDTLVNGSIGKVVAFMSETTFDYYHQAEDDFQEFDGVGEEDEKLQQSRSKIRDMFSKENPSASTSQVWPLVRFQIADGSSRDLLCQRESWKIELPNGEVQAARSQVPLILAWALSIHKAQGQTLERVKVDLGKIFEKGQAYVALSRATSQEGLQIMRFDPKKVMAHDKVRVFYDSLYSIDETIKGGRAGGGGVIGRDRRVEGFGFEEEEEMLMSMYGYDGA